MGLLDKLTGKISGALRMAQGNEDLAGSGVRGTAAILEVERTGRTIGLTSADGYSKDSESEIVRVHARITLPGREPYEITHDTTQEPVAGNDVTCFVDEKNDQRVHYELGTGLQQALAADPNTAAQVAASLSQVLGRDVGTDPASLEAAMNEIAQRGQQPG